MEHCYLNPHHVMRRRDDRGYDRGYERGRGGYDDRRDRGGYEDRGRGGGGYDDGYRSGSGRRSDYEVSMCPPAASAHTPAHERHSAWAPKAIDVAQAPTKDAKG